MVSYIFYFATEPDKIYKQSQESHDEDAKLKQDREAFQRQLEEKWEE